MMTLDEIFEMRRIIITSGLPDDKIERLNELMDKSREDSRLAGYEAGHYDGYSTGERNGRKYAFKDMLTKYKEIFAAPESQERNKFEIVLFAMVDYIKEQIV